MQFGLGLRFLGRRLALKLFPVVEDRPDFAA